MRISDWSSDVCSSDLTGDGLALVGLGVLLWWLGALASGPEAYARFAELAVTIPGRVVLIGLSWALFTHLMSGLRHFVLDIGAGYELGTNRLWSIAAPEIGRASGRERVWQ